MIAFYSQNNVQICKKQYKEKGNLAMKATGIVRKIDELGRIVLPIELRRTMNIAVKDSLEIFVDGDSIILKKYSPSCIFCGQTEGILTFKGKNVCADCKRYIKNEITED